MNGEFGKPVEIKALEEAMFLPEDEPVGKKRPSDELKTPDEQQMTIGAPTETEKSDILLQESLTEPTTRLPKAKEPIRPPVRPPIGAEQELARRKLELGAELQRHYTAQGYSEEEALKIAREEIEKRETYPPERRGFEPPEPVDPGLMGFIRGIGRVGARQVIPLDIETAREARIGRTKEATKELEGLGFMDSLRLAWQGLEQAMSEEEAGRAGMAKPWVRDVRDALATGLGSAIPPATIVDTMSQAVFGYDIPVVSSYQEVARGVSQGVGGLVEGKDDISKVDAKELAKRSASIAATSDAGLALRQTLGMITPEEAQETRELLQPTENMSALWETVRRAQEAGDDKETIAQQVSESVPLMAPTDFPSRPQFSAPTISDLEALIRANPDLRDTDTLAPVTAALRLGNPKAAQDLLARMRYGEMPDEWQRRFTPNTEAVLGIAGDMTRMWRETGGESSTMLAEIFGSAMVDKAETEEGGYIESSFGRAMRLAGTLQTGILEADISPFSVLATGLREVAPEEMAEMVEPMAKSLGEVRLPTPAGIDLMLGSEYIGATLREDLGIYDYERIRDPDSTWWARTMARTQTGDQGLVLEIPDILIQAGVDEKSSWVSVGQTLGLGADFVVPWEGYALKPLTAPLGAARRGMKAARFAPKGARAKFAAAGVAPTVFAGLEKTKLRGRITSLQDELAGITGETAQVEARRARVQRSIDSANDSLKLLEDPDFYTVVGFVAGETAAHRILSGADKDPLKALPREIREGVMEMARTISDPEEFSKAVQNMSANGRNVYMKALADMLENGTPEMKKLRGTDAYRRFDGEMDELVAAGNIKADEKPYAMAFFEFLSHRVANDPEIPDILEPADLFGQTRVRIGGEPGEFALFQEAGLRRTPFFKKLADEVEELQLAGADDVEIRDYIRDRLLEPGEVSTMERVPSRLGQRWILEQQEHVRKIREQLSEQERIATGLERRGEVELAEAIRAVHTDPPPGHHFIPEPPSIAGEADALARELTYETPAGIKTASAQIALPLRSMEDLDLAVIADALTNQGFYAEPRLLGKRGFFTLEKPPDMDATEFADTVRRVYRAIRDNVEAGPLPRGVERFAKALNLSPERIKRSVALRWFRENIELPEEVPSAAYPGAEKARRGIRAELPEVARIRAARREEVGRPGVLGARPVGRRGATPEERKAWISARRAEVPEWRRAGLAEEPPPEVPVRAMPAGEMRRAMGAAEDTIADVLFEIRRGERLGYFEEVDDKGIRHLIGMFRNGDLNTMFHEGGHLMRHVLGRRMFDEFAQHFGAEMDAAGKVRLTREGEEAAAESFRWYARTRLAPGGRMRQLMDEAYVAFQNIAARVKGKDPLLPAAMEAKMDAYFRPLEPIKPHAITLARNSVRELPSVKVAPTAAERIAEAKVPRAGKGREYLRVDATAEGTMTALGLKATDDAVDTLEMYKGLVRSVTAERARMLWGKDLKRLTSRTVVPATRMKRIFRDVRNQLAELGEAKALANQINRETNVIDLTVNQQASLKSIVDDLNNDPLGNGLAPSLLEKLKQGDGADWSTLSPQEYNSIVEVVIDQNAGIGSRRSRLGESVAPTTAHGLVKGISRAAEKLGQSIPAVQRVQDQFVRMFKVPEFGVDYLDPGVREIYQARVRELRSISPWMIRQVRQLWKDSPAESLRNIMGGLKRQLSPPVNPGAVDQLMKLDQEFSGLRPAVEEGRVSGMSVGGWDGNKTSLIRGIFKWGNQLTNEESIALGVLDRFITDGHPAAVKAGKKLSLDDADLAVYEDAFRVVDQGIKRRKAVMEHRARKILIAASGSLDENILKSINDSTELAETYKKFFNPQAGFSWDDIFDIAGRHGRDVRPHVFDQDVAVIEMITRMRGEEIMEGLADDLAKHGLTVDISAEVMKGDFAAKNRDLFIDRVRYYMDKVLSWGETRQWVESVTPEGQLKIGPEYLPEAPPTEIFPTAERAVARKRGFPKDEAWGVHDMEAYTMAHRIFAQWGHKFGMGNWKRTNIGGTDMLLPDMMVANMQESLDRVAKLGLAFGRREPKPGASKVINEILRLNPLTYTKIKMGMTTGIMLPNPAYYMANLLGGVFQVYQGAGIGAAAKAVFKMPGELAGLAIRRPNLTGAVVAKLWKEGEYARSARPLITSDGRIYTSDMLAEMAQREGLKSSFIQAETARTIAQEIRDLEPTFWNKMMKTPRWWQKNLIEGATAVDNYFRVGVFVDALKRGESPASAAEIARTIGYDYSALTDWEKNVARKGILFYSYMRKNMDLFHHTLAYNPHRIMGQLRLMHGLQNGWMQDEPEIVLQEWQKGRLPAWFRGIGGSSHLKGEKEDPNSNIYSQTMWLTTPLPAQDALAFYIDLFDIFGHGVMTGRLNEDEVEAFRQLMGRVNPMVRSAIEIGVNKDLFTGRELGVYDRVPPWLVEIDRLGTGGMLVDDILQVQPRNHYDFGKADAPGAQWYNAGRSWAWVVYRNMWQLPGGGRSMDTLTWLDRSGGLGMRPIETMENALRHYRIQGEEQGFDILGHQFFLDPLPPDRQPLGRIGEDVLIPYPGTSELDMFWGLIGFKPYQVPHQMIAADRLRLNLARAIKEQQMELRRARPTRYVEQLSP